MGVNVSFLFANDDVGKDCDADAAAVADHAVVVVGLWHSGTSNVAGWARLSRWHVDVREEGFDSRSCALGAAKLTPRRDAESNRTNEKGKGAVREQLLGVH